MLDLLLVLGKRTSKERKDTPPMHAKIERKSG
jgi:hypothetical protein